MSAVSDAAEHSAPLPADFRGRKRGSDAAASGDFGGYPGGCQRAGGSRAPADTQRGSGLLHGLSWAGAVAGVASGYGKATVVVDTSPQAPGGRGSSCSSSGSGGMPRVAEAAEGLAAAAAPHWPWQALLPAHASPNFQHGTAGSHSPVLTQLFAPSAAPAPTNAAAAPPDAGQATGSAALPQGFQRADEAAAASAQPGHRKSQGFDPLLARLCAAASCRIADDELYF